jgi:hypothetical protein
MKRQRDHTAKASQRILVSAFIGRLFFQQHENKKKDKTGSGQSLRQTLDDAGGRALTTHRGQSYDQKKDSQA